MRVFDVHIHIQPWEMLKPEVLSMLSDPSHANAKDILASADNVVRFLDPAQAHDRNFDGFPRFVHQAQSDRLDRRARSSDLDLAERR